MSSYIPIEIIDNILGFCDKSTIASCSLACNNWTMVCQSRLFSRLCIRTWADSTGSGVFAGKRDIHTIDKNTRILQHIREIYFDFPRVSPSYSLPSTHLRSLTSLFNELEGNVKRLERIEIYSELTHILRGRNGDPTLDLRSSIPASFTGISQLEIRAECKKLRFLLLFGCSFPKLKVLKFDCYSAEVSPGDALCVLTLPESIKSFRFDVCVGREVAVPYYKTWLTSHPPRKISHLVLSNRSLADARSYAPVCQYTLSMIELEFPGYPRTHNSDLVSQDLSPFFALDTVTFRFLPTKKCRLPAVISTLTTVTSLHLSKIVLTLDESCMDPGELEAVTDAWIRLDDILGTPLFCRTVLEIRVTRSEAPDFTQNDREEKVRLLLQASSSQHRLLFIYDW
ncbi:hypothetical protein L218DRAFT_966577 [Marasmius fiardii PR-910]|nr:hypothetical protein L218DRAFT_966577 [Marasmius fiardii PR-910]